MTTTENLLPSGLPRIEHLEMRQITKRFPGVLANDHVDFDVRAGEIHALLGENGAGKSTLMKILYGLYQPDEGDIFINGKRVAIQSPTDAIRHGIGMIHQHFMLVETVTVAENVALGLRAPHEPLLDLATVSRRIVELADRYGLQVDPGAVIHDLAVGERQRVEIIKALYRGAALLILDEPTAVLTPQEVEDLFQIFRHMAEEGHALIFISHKMNEIFALTDRVTVLRDGRVIGTKRTKETNKRELARMMVGREVLFTREKKPIQPGEVRLKLEHVNVVGKNHLPVLKDISFEVRSGEILGVAGVSGNGQRPLAESIVGLQHIASGHVYIEGKEVTHYPPAEMYKIGLSYIPEERMHDGVIKDFSVADNAILQDHERPPFSRGIFLNFKAIEDHARELVRTFRIKTPGLKTPVKNLSGGNIQKLILARELSRGPRVLIAAQPTRGVDIGATEYIHARLLEQREQGLATLLISEDLDEVKALSDRIMVLYRGEIMGIVEAEKVTIEELGLMMAGEKRLTVETAASS